MNKYAIAACTFVFSIFVVAAASAGVPEIGTYRTGIDLDNTPASGCDFDLGGVAPGSLPGFELEATIEVDSSQIPPQLVSAQLAVCDGSGFANPVALTGVMLELNSGFLGADSIITAIPASSLAGATSIRLAHYARSADGSEDILISGDGTSQGGAITFSLSGAASPAPTLSSIALLAALLVLTAVACVQMRRRTWGSASALAIAALTFAAAVVQAQFGDPIATDATSDASPDGPRAEIFASYAMTSNSGVVLRLDIEDLESPPPPTSTPTSTATSTATATASQTSTATSTATATASDTSTATSTATATASHTSTATSTATATASDTPTATETATATATPSSTPRTPALFCDDVRNCTCDDLDPCTFDRCLRDNNTGLCRCDFVGHPAPPPECLD